MLNKALVSLLVSAVVTLPAWGAGEVNVYSARKENLIKPVLDQFAAAHNVKVNLITGNADALITRIKTEGKYSPADVLLTTDVGRLQRAKQQDLLQSVDSDLLEQHVPERLQDSDNQWFALTQRARPIMYAKDRVKASELSSMEALTEAQWKGRICIRSSGNIYNQSLIAAMIEQIGAKKTQSWAQALVKNFARPPQGGDRDQIKAVAAGVCDIAIANTYYLAGMLNSQDQAEVQAAEQVAVFWPNQADRGAHVNISGAAVTQHAPNAANAKALLEFMLNKDAQAWYAETNHEYPVRADVAWSETLQGFGEFKPESINLYRVGELNAESIRVMDKAGWQ